jgi:hypothetical protein
MSTLSVAAVRSCTGPSCRKSATAAHSAARSPRTLASSWPAAGWAAEWPAAASAPRLAAFPAMSPLAERPGPVAERSASTADSRSAGWNGLLRQATPAGARSVSPPVTSRQRRAESGSAARSSSISAVPGSPPRWASISSTS